MLPSLHYETFRKTRWSSYSGNNVTIPVTLPLNDLQTVVTSLLWGGDKKIAKIMMDDPKIVKMVFDAIKTSFENEELEEYFSGLGAGDIFGEKEAVYFHKLAERLGDDDY